MTSRPIKCFTGLVLLLTLALGPALASSGAALAAGNRGGEGVYLGPVRSAIHLLPARGTSHTAGSKRRRAADQTSGSTSCVNSSTDNVVWPANWSCTDVGTTVLAGSQNDPFNVTGAGTFWAGTTADSLHFAYQELAGNDGSETSVGAAISYNYTATTSSYNPYELGGLMVRQSAEAGSPFYCVCLYGTGTAPAGDNGQMNMVIVYRTTFGAPVGMLNTDYVWDAQSQTVHMRLVRLGNTFSAYSVLVSANPHYTLVGNSMVTINMPQTVLWGVAASSGNFTSVESFWPDQIHFVMDGIPLQETIGPGTPSGNNPNCSTGSPVNCATGDFWHTFRDLSIPGRGLPLAFTRTYNSLLAAHDSPLGFGWTDNYNMYLTEDASNAITLHEEGGSAITFPYYTGEYHSPRGVFAPLWRNNDGTFSFVRANQVRYTFSAPSTTAAGLLLKEADRNGYVTTLGYTNGQLTTVTDSAGRSLTLSYNAANRISSVTDWTNRSVIFGYDAAGDLTDVTDVGGGHTAFTYDAEHLLLTMQDPRQTAIGGPALANVYDSSGRVIQQTDPLGHVTHYAYSGTPDDQTTTMRDANNNVTVEHYQNYVLTSLTRGAGTSSAATWTFGYDPDTLGLVNVTDPGGHMWEYGWDFSGNLAERIDPLGHQTEYTYDSLNDLASVTDPNGIQTTLSYDSSGKLLSVSIPLSGTAQTATTTYTYGDTSHPADLTAVTDPDGHTTSMTYESTTDNLLSATDAAGDRTTYGYDGLGRVTSRVSPNGNVAGGNPGAYTTTYGYNAFGDLTRPATGTGQREQGVVLLPGRPGEHACDRQ